MENELPTINVYPDEVTPPPPPPASAGGTNLDAPPQEIPQGGINLAPPGAETSLPTPEIADRRARDTEYGSGKLIARDRKSIYQDYIEGKEDQVRVATASANDNWRQQTKTEKIIGLAKAQGGFTPQQLSWAMNPFEPTDPQSVIETNYGVKYIAETVPAAARMEAPLLPEAQKEIPEQVQQLSEKSSDLVAKRQYAYGLIEDLEKEVKGQGWVPWLADQAKSLTQIYPELKLRSNVEGVSFLNGLLGDNLKEQADTLIMQPMGEYQKNLKSVIDNLRKDNPTLALQFAHQVFGVSTSERRLNNFFTLMAVPDAALGLKASTALARKVSLWNRSNEMFKSMVEEAKPTRSPQINAAEGAGDLSEASAQAVTEKIVSGKINPAEDLVDGLPTSMKLGQDMIDIADTYVSDAKDLSRELRTRLRDGVEQHATKFSEKIDTAIRVNRTPVPLAVRSAIDAIRETIKDLYPGLRNAIMDVGDPFRHSTTNTWHSELQIGNIGGDLFTKRETAEGFARLNGLADAKILKREGILTPKQIEKDVARKQILEEHLRKIDDAIIMRKKEIQDKNTTADRKAWAKEQVKGLNEGFKRKYTNELRSIEERLKDGMTPVTVKQKGMGYYISVTKPLDEATNAFRDNLIKQGDSFVKEAVGVAHQSDSVRWRNAFLGFLRGADDTLALNDTIQRKVATYGPKELQKVGDELAKNIEQLRTGSITHDPVTGEAYPWWKSKAVGFKNKITLSNKEVLEQFNKTLKHANDAKDPATGQQGYFFRTAGELEDFYQRNFDRMPTFAEHQAYLGAVQVKEFERALQEIAEFRYRSRLGTQQHSITILDNQGKKFTSKFFDGIIKRQFPGGSGNILIMGSRKGDETMRTLGSIPQKELERYQAGVKSGEYKVIELYDSKHYPLSGFSDVAGNEYIQYVLARNVDTKGLEYNHVVRRGGGHFEYDYSHYIKQAKIVPNRIMDDPRDKRSFRHLYLGDNTFMPIENGALGKDIAKHLNAISKFMKDKDYAGAEAYHTQVKFPMDWKELKSKYFPKKDSNGIIHPAAIDVDEPFHVVPRDKNIFDMDKNLEMRYTQIDPHGNVVKSTFENGLKTGSPADQYRVAWNTERDADGVYTIAAEGTKQNPIYKYIPAETVDPLTTINRGLDRMINSIFMDDYKIMSMEHWLREAAPYLRESESSIRNSPGWNFYNSGDEAAFKPGTPWDIKRNLLGNHFKIRSFLGVPDKFDTAVHSLTQKLIDSAYERFGPADGRTMAQKAITIPPIWVLNHIKDPIDLMRGFAFNAKLGVFAIPQILVQMQTYASIWALEPRRGLAGTYAMQLHTWARINKTPAFIDKLDSMASKLNFAGVKFKPGEFKEAWKLINETGFENVGGEYAARDTTKHEFIGGSFGNFLKAGQVFFREGERGVRTGAFYTAYKKWRDANPGVAITNDIKGKILNDADLLGNNMSRASNSILHGGVLSLPAQFLSYQIRLAELFMSKRIGETVTQRNLARVRMVMSYSALYGAPGALGLTGLPLGDSIRQAYIDNGYVPGENFIETLLKEGLPSTLMALATGGGDLEKGDFFNVYGRMGAQGFTSLQDFFRGDKTFLETAGGAGLSTVMGTLTAGDGFLRAMASMVRGDNAEQAYKFTPDNFIAPLKEVSSIKAAWGFLAAVNTGKWLSRNGVYVTDTSPAKALFQTLTGLSPLEQETAWYKNSLSKERVEHQKWALKRFTEEYRKGLIESERNPTLSNKYITNAFVILEQAGYPPEKRASAIAIARKGNESLVKSSAFNFVFKNQESDGRKYFGLMDKESKHDTRIEQYRKEQQILEKKENN